ncbi:hypothetical protein [Alicyclobacillus sp. ALC3]|uniref:hypothetical protein n=1 Tax=Alicyclobacillus sp. ALC3 TaxID=2796143 RepID=UPI002378AFED|nr:hypothetical protein [Alicyclobacillus sp. ALC3]WDL97788.1 hypothetical protein JC200_03395 [Alicyclobacillus sp. ALC3]
MKRKLLHLLRKLLSYALMGEGIYHFLFSTIAIVGLVAQHQYGFFSWLTPITDYLAGTLTLVAGWVFRGKPKESGPRGR